MPVMRVVEDGQIVGIVTDADFRNRVVAEACACDITVGKIMTPRPLTLTPDALAFDALASMMQRKISHMPIVEGARLVGVLTQTDLVRAQSRSAVFMIGEIGRKPDVTSMAAIVAEVPRLLVSLVASGASVHKIGHIISSVTDAVTNRLITLAEDRLGPPPVPYLLLACGSQGCQEQTGVSDQDNSMILSDDYDEARHGEYFRAFSRFVCDGLDAAGYVYCPGEMMAMTDKWRQPLAQWRRYFRKWIDQPEPMAQMLASVMFDLRAIRNRRPRMRAGGRRARTSKRRAICPPLTLDGHRLPCLYRICMIALASEVTMPMIVLNNTSARTSDVEAVDILDR